MDAKYGQFLTLPTTKQVAEIYAEINTTEEKIDKDVDLLLEWVRKQPHMPNLDDEKRKVKSFLIGCKNSLERTKEMLDNHYTLRALCPKYFIESDLENSAIIKLSEYRVFAPLPMITREGNRVIIDHLKSETFIFDIVVTMKVMLMNIDIRMSKLDIFKKDIYILDMKYYSLSRLLESLPHIHEMSLYLNIFIAAFLRIVIFTTVRYHRYLIQICHVITVPRPPCDGFFKFMNFEFFYHLNFDFNFFNFAVYNFTNILIAICK
ncbi:uncharacterized protein LOC126894555 isoform X9 [Daktulosphaira vitifoliae]|uniref:uncharacterized protein LOC126894555 isoform X9 n=1 Tax=Daktulosphaira vitifoliae TaxID=58002 RepID=UPI0021AA75E9|nr:uncharacterized protein LOC126894555 isoform X9 [Daktulosphaira vitifoliae]